MLVLAAVAVPLTVHAESSLDVFPLVFCGGTNADGTPQPACTVCDLLKLIDKIKNLVLLFILPTIGAILVVVSGFMFVLGGQFPGRVQQAKSILLNVAIGVAIVSLAWLFTNTILQSFAKGDNVSNSWTSIECTAPEATLPPTGGTGGTGGTTGTGTSAAETAARNYLAAHGIGVNNPPCPAGQTTGCTTLAGVRQQTLDAIVSLKNRCNCSVTITAGSEGGHEPGTYSHATGYKVDLRYDTNTFSTITHFPQLPTRSDGAEQWQDPATGAIYALESDHWDVLVK